MVGWLCWGLTSQSTIFQSCRDGAIASWVVNQYFRGVKCLAQGHNTAAVGLEPRTSRSGVRHSTTEPPRSPILCVWNVVLCRKPAIAHLGARISNENVLFYVLYVVEVWWVVQYFLGFCFTYYTVTYFIYFFCLSMSCIFIIIYSISFIRFHPISLRKM